MESIIKVKKNMSHTYGSSKYADELKMRNDEVTLLEKNTKAK